MNKTKRIATAVVSIVLASTMLVGITACDNSNTVDSSSSSSTTSSSSAGGTTSTDSSSTTSSSSGTGTIKELTPSQAALTPTTDSDGNLSYASGTTLNMNVGYSTNNNAKISYSSANFSGSVVLPDGNTYTQGSLKPAWKELSSTLGINFTDGYTNLSASAQITDIISTTLTSYNVITAQSSTIVTAATSDADTFLDLSLYLDYMPNYKKFLQDNPIVYMSLTSDTDSGAMYYAPYFDGNDDIEKYEIAKKNWVTAVLEDDYTASNTITFADSVSAKSTSVGTKYGFNSTAASVESYMGTTGEWWIESTDPADTDSYSDTVKITVSYSDALTAAKDESTPLGAAYKAAAGSVYSGTSGNIVDIQNAAINAKSGAVTGDALTQILRAYIDVAYQDENGNKYYTNRGDVFNGVDAAWDVDLLVALMRCIVTFGNSNLGTDSANVDIYGITGRQNTSQRLSDMYSLAGELYGVRGFTSRYNFTYIDENGTLQEARAEEETYDALDKMHAMVQEGLINATGKQAQNKTSYYTASGVPESFMIYDYVQTQTANGGYAKMGITSISTLEDDYDFEPIVTPVSRWDDGSTDTDANVDGISYSYDNSGNKYMRFTESWRSVKNTGFCVPRASVENDPDKLAAVLTFIDYFFSNDGQILMTFGGQSTTNNAEKSTADYSGTSDDGWWYANKVTDVSISSVATLVGDQYYINDEYAAQYFCYNNELYTGTLYNGKQYPIMTNSSLAFYYGYSVNGVDQDASDSVFDQKTGIGVLSYTNYARYIIGSALPIGNKLQAFEFQCTSDQGINGGNIVGYGLVNGTISHVFQTVGADNGKGYWYTEVPTTLPYDSATSSYIGTGTITTLDSTIFANASGVETNYFIDIIFYGYGGAASLSYLSLSAVPANAAACIAQLTTNYDLTTYVLVMQLAWDDINSFYYDYIVYLQ